MVLYRTDRVVLYHLKRAQKTLSGCVHVTDTDFRFCADFTPQDAKNAMDDPIHVENIHLSKVELQASLSRLKSLGLIVHPALAPIYQVTYDGWNARSVRAHEILKALVTNFVFPSLVAFVTTLLTLLLNGHLN